MTKDQRKKILNYLADKDRFREMVFDKAFRSDNHYWYFGEDRLPVSKEDGSCSSINERLIDPLLFNWLVEALPATSEETSDCESDDDSEDIDEMDQPMAPAGFEKGEAGQVYMKEIASDGNVSFVWVNPLSG